MNICTPIGASGARVGPFFRLELSRTRLGRLLRLRALTSRREQRQSCNARFRKVGREDLRPEIRTEQLVDHRRIELLTAASNELVADYLLAQRIPVRTLRGHSIERICQHDNARCERDIFTREAIWIAGSVPVLVVMPDRGYDVP